ncbi:hypothetical protein POPTR_014G028650v4 [Populus trichocarpa]|uniref:Uncharacterized protein n=1 Tax=Populus trichocarpa TaxID=3694 RepID=B9MVZ2_POPTR|nr:hypothetical protein BDE02_14G022100 [Populus trichocarpa]PNT02558.2 hypothetical protein POPTR_014G028650v4 [Populus trichocarpa]
MRSATVCLPSFQSPYSLVPEYMRPFLSKYSAHQNPMSFHLLSSPEPLAQHLVLRMITGQHCEEGAYLIAVCRAILCVLV